MSEDERLARIDTIGVVGRVAPEHKVLMVETLRKKGEVVAMTGDGVNDAPAIKAADIGIAMGTGTQVAKNAGRMILTDDNFATIVRAVSEGRKLYDNMLKYIRFMLVALVTYVVTFLLASVLNIAGGQPFSAIQILWINFVITAPVGIALGLDKETPGLMKRQPRPRAASIMSPAVILTVGLVGVFMSLAIDFLIVAGKNAYGQIEIASTMGLVAFSLMLVVAAYESRDEKGSVLRLETFDNRTLNVTAVIEIVLAVMIARGAALTSFLGGAGLSSNQWLLGALPAGVLFPWLGDRQGHRAAQPQGASGTWCRPQVLTDASLRSASPQVTASEKRPGRIRTCATASGGRCSSPELRGPTRSAQNRAEEKCTSVEPASPPGAYSRPRATTRDSALTLPGYPSLCRGRGDLRGPAAVELRLPGRSAARGDPGDATAVGRAPGRRVIPGGGPPGAAPAGSDRPEPDRAAHRPGRGPAGRDSRVRRHRPATERAGGRPHPRRTGAVWLEGKGSDRHRGPVLHPLGRSARRPLPRRGLR